MEWFYGPKGLRFSEIGCRPPGVGAWDLYSAANDIDIYREWAHAIVHGRAGAAPMPRAYAAGIIALRPDRDGRIPGYEGVDEVHARLGEWIIDAHLPDPGHADPAGRGRLHGERVDPHAPPRLRRAARRCSTTSAAPSGARAEHDAVVSASVRPSCSARSGFLRRWAPSPLRAPEGPVATVTAGWQEREADDAELDERAGGPQPQPAPLRAADRRARPRPGVRRGRPGPPRRLDELQELYLAAASSARSRASTRVARRPSGPASSTAPSPSGARPARPRRLVPRGPSTSCTPSSRRRPPERARRSRAQREEVAELLARRGGARRSPAATSAILLTACTCSPSTPRRARPWSPGRPGRWR